MKFLTFTTLLGLALADESERIGSGQCQAMAGYDFFDLKKFDEFGRNKDKKTPATISGFLNNREFIYKACQPKFNMKDSYTTYSMNSDCGSIEAGNAYWMDGGSCLYSFKDSTFTGNNVTEGEKVQSDSDEDDDGGVPTHDGFTLTFSSQQNCENDAPFIFTLVGKCLSDKSDSKYNTFEATSQENCAAQAIYYGPDACVDYTFDLQKALDAVTPLIGAFLIVFGGLMTFFGARFIFQVFAFLVFLLVTGIFFLTSYNFFLSDKHTTTTVLVIVLVAGMALGGLVSYGTYKFAKAWTVTILGAWAGIAIFLTIAKLANLNKPSESILAAVLGALLGGYVGKKLNRLIRSVGTALIGAYITTRGVGCYAGGYPSETDFAGNIKDGDFQVENNIWYYFGGMLGLFVIGTIVQLYLFRDEGKDEEDFMATEDESRKCGCF